MSIAGAGAPPEARPPRSGGLADGGRPSLSTEYEQLNGKPITGEAFTKLAELLEILEHKWFKELDADEKKLAIRLTISAFWFFWKKGFQTILAHEVTFEHEKFVDAHKAQASANSYQTNFLRKEFGDYIRVFERQGRGVTHYHYLVAARCDIRTGFDFDAQWLLDHTTVEGGVSDQRPSPQRGYGGSKAWWKVNKKRNDSACDYLRDLWARGRKISKRKKYGGVSRMSFLPIKSTESGIIAYLAKYFGKDFGVRIPADKGVRRLNMSKGAGACRGRLTLLSIGRDNYSDKTAMLASRCGYNSENYQAQFGKLLGPCWAYWLKTDIMVGMLLPVYRSACHAKVDGAIGSDEVNEIYLTNGPLENALELQVNPQRVNQSIQLAICKLQDRAAKWAAFMGDTGVSLPSDVASKVRYRALTGNELPSEVQVRDVFRRTIKEPDYSIFGR